METSCSGEKQHGQNETTSIGVELICCFFLNCGFISFSMKIQLTTFC